MNNKILKITKSIAEWSKKLQTQGFNYSRKLASARNFITDYSGKLWTFGKSVGDSGEYHDNGAAARKHLVSIGFVDVLELPENNELRREIIDSFRDWAIKIKVLDLNRKLDRYLSDELYIKMRLLIPPNFK